MNKIYFFIVYFICSFYINASPSTINLKVGAGAVYTEDFFVILYKSQPSFTLETGGSYRHSFSRLNMIVKAEIYGYGGNFYIKNYLPYYTDKTYTIDLTFDTNIGFTKKTSSIISPYWGSGFTFLFLYETYSLGKLLDYSEMRNIPYPYIFAGFIFKPIHFFELSIIHITGGTIGYRANYVSDILKHNLSDIVITHILNVEATLHIQKNISFYINWKNRLFTALDTFDIIGKIYWSNFITTGVSIGIK